MQIPFKIEHRQTIDRLPGQAATGASHRPAAGRPSKDLQPADHPRTCSRPATQGPSPSDSDVARTSTPQVCSVLSQLIRTSNSSILPLREKVRAMPIRPDHKEAHLLNGEGKDGFLKKVNELFKNLGYL